MVALKQVERIVEELRHAEEKRQAPAPPDLAFRLLFDKRRVDRLFDELRRSPSWEGAGDSFGLVETGLAAVADFVRPDP